MVYSPSISPLEQHIQVILTTRDFDRTTRLRSNSNEVREKISILREYIMTDWDSILEFQQSVADNIGVDFHHLVNMWPQIADGMIASESDYN